MEGSQCNCGESVIGKYSSHINTYIKRNNRDVDVTEIINVQTNKTILLNNYKVYFMNVITQHTVHREFGEMFFVQNESCSHSVYRKVINEESCNNLQFSSVAGVLLTQVCGTKNTTDHQKRPFFTNTSDID